MAEKVYAVVYDTGGWGFTGFDLKRATQYANNVGGVLVELPIIADFREPAVKEEERV